MKETVLVYRDSLQDIEERREKFSLVAWQNDWEAYNVQKREGNSPYILTYVTPDEKSAINYVENYVLDIPHIVIRGEEQGKIAKILSASIDFYRVSELQEFIHSDPVDDEQLARAIYLFGVAAGRGESNTSYFSTLEFCLTHPVSNVRRAAMLSVGGIGWYEFKPILENIRDNDPDPELRSYANTTLEALQTHVWSLHAEKV
jgi:hypothetical protein